MISVSSKYWVLVADSGHARILELRKKPKELRQLQELVSESRHLASRDMVSDASGRAFHVKGPSSHSKQQRSDAHDQAEQAFSRMLVRKLEMFPVECVARGYLAGSGWKEYREQGTVCDLPLPEGLQQADRLPETIFTPATKAESGHDENIPFETMMEMVGRADAERLRELTVAIYERGARYARSRGILLADTKFEFGRAGGELVLADEVLTPDSSRFWDVETYRSGISPPSYDKQYLRDYLEKIGWEKQPPVPGLPDEIVTGIRDRYLEIYRKLTGGNLAAESA